MGILRGIPQAPCIEYLGVLSCLCFLVLPGSPMHCFSLDSGPLAACRPFQTDSWKAVSMWFHSVAVRIFKTGVNRSGTRLLVFSARDTVAVNGPFQSQRVRDLTLWSALLIRLRFSPDPTRWRCVSSSCVQPWTPVSHCLGQNQTPILRTVNV